MKATVSATLDELVEEKGGTVTPEEAARSIVAAAVYQGIADYRMELFNGCQRSLGGTYSINKNFTCYECERFFEDVGFTHYKVLPERIIRLRMQVDKLLQAKKFPEKRTKLFTCPICKNGEVYGWKRISKPKTANGKPKELSLVSCMGCGFKGTIYT